MRQIVKDTLSNPNATLFRYSDREYVGANPQYAVDEWGRATKIVPGIPYIRYTYEKFQEATGND